MEPDRHNNPMTLKRIFRGVGLDFSDSNGYYSQLVQLILYMLPHQYERQLKIELPPGRSAFLWGARQTGKSTLLRKQFPRSVFYDLLDSDVMIRFLSRPRLLGDELQSFDSADLTQPVIIDEVQKVPNLLNEVHRLIESYGYSFILCGSSARKLNQSGVNLLGGRAWRLELYPLSWSEVPKFDLLVAMSTGLLPGLYAQPDQCRSLDAYVRDYLTQEIFNEALVRNSAGFLRFFDALSYCHGEMLNYSSIARDCAIDAKTVRTYFEILADTLIGYFVNPFRKRGTRQAISSAPKFYLFDIGIASHICGHSIAHTRGREFGRSFEHFIFLEMIAARGYQKSADRIEYWRTKHGLEVDFVLGNGAIAIEVKNRIRSGDLRAMKAFKEEFRPRRSIIVSMEPANRVVDGIEVLNYEHFLDELHQGRVLSN